MRRTLAMLGIAVAVIMLMVIASNEAMAATGTAEVGISPQIRAPSGVYLGAKWSSDGGWRYNANTGWYWDPNAGFRWNGKGNNWEDGLVEGQTWGGWKSGNSQGNGSGKTTTTIATEATTTTSTASTTTTPQTTTSVPLTTTTTTTSTSAGLAPPPPQQPGGTSPTASTAATLPETSASNVVVLSFAEPPQPTKAPLAAEGKLTQVAELVVSLISSFLGLSVEGLRISLLTILFPLMMATGITIWDGNHSEFDLEREG
jgi:hypothetical protein